MDQLATEIGLAFSYHTAISTMKRFLTASAQTISLHTQSTAEMLLTGIGQAFQPHQRSAMKGLLPEIAITYPLHTALIRHPAAVAFRYINTVYNLLDASPKTLNHQNVKMDPEMINAEYELTIGVEFEAIVAFHETILRETLQTLNSNMVIIKTIPDEVRVRISQVHTRYELSRRSYMGWGLTTPTSYNPNGEDKERRPQFESHLKDYEVRGYAGEILSLVKRILGGRILVHDSWTKCNSFEEWHLTHDNSLLGVAKHILADKLNAMGHQIDNIDNWDAHPVELVSRILPFSSDSLKEISELLNNLVGTPSSQYAAFTNEWCGTHVHVGLPVPVNLAAGALPPTFTLPTLQHLAYILTMYEKSIMTLFPPSRRAHSTNANIELRSNLSEFHEEPKERPYDPDDDDLTPSEYDAKYPPAEDFSFASARDKIFAPNQTIENLVDIICPTDKHHLVNFRNLLRTDGMPRTIEFRQMEGTLDARDATNWATFVAGLVRLAESKGREYGAGEGYDGEGYLCTEADQLPEVMDLIRMMQWEEGKDWVEERVQRWEREEREQGEQEEGMEE